MQSKATTVAAYLQSLPPERRDALQAVRDVILANLDKGFEEGMSYGMMGYHVPHSIFPAGYHCDPKQPLPYAGLASQKQSMSLYLMGLYIGGEPGTESAESTWFRQAWAKTGKKLDMGKSCIRFKRVEDLALDVIAQSLRRVPLKVYVERYVASLAGRNAAKAKKPTKARASIKSTTPSKPVRGAPTQSRTKSAKKATRPTAASPRRTRAGATRGGTRGASRT